MNNVDKTDSNSLFVEEQNVLNRETKNLESSESNSSGRSTSTILPRFGWQDKKAFFKILRKTKRVLDFAEINMTFD
ncbi:MAG: hypothetical protein ACRC2R_17000 [Xenococcaceae cyanobacterium]